MSTEDQNKDLEIEDEMEDNLIVEEGEEDELVNNHKHITYNNSQGLDVDLAEISKQCEELGTQVKVRDPSKQRQKFDSASYEKERQEKRKSKEQKLNNTNK